jgi:N-methylhydantoinase A/oxoprolinase/acetone carboxylase beta subunit
VSYRRRVRGAVPKLHACPEPTRAVGRPAGAPRKGTRMVYFDSAMATTTALYERDRLDVGATLAGPAIVEQFDATTVVPSGWHAVVDRRRNLVLARG